MGEITKVISAAYGWLGAKEGDKRYQEIIDTFESNKKYPYDGQGCCEYVCAVFIKALGLKRAKQLIPVINYSKLQFEKWKEISKEPKPGCLVYFGSPVEHVELVVDIAGDTLTTIDGNSYHTVVERKRSRKEKSIAGYGVPDFAEDKEYLFNKWTDAVIRSVELKKNSRGDLVLFMQQYLHDRGFYTGYMDGVFGDYMHEAVRKWQKANNLLADGIVGRYCWTYILK